MHYILHICITYGTDALHMVHIDPLYGIMYYMSRKNISISLNAEELELVTRCAEYCEESVGVYMKRSVLKYAAIDEVLSGAYGVELEAYLQNGGDPKKVGDVDWERTIEDAE